MTGAESTLGRGATGALRQRACDWILSIFSSPRAAIRIAVLFVISSSALLDTSSAMTRRFLFLNQQL
jgi:hypothetical protein